MIATSLSRSLPASRAGLGHLLAVPALGRATGMAPGHGPALGRCSLRRRGSGARLSSPCLVRPLSRQRVAQDRSWPSPTLMLALVLAPSLLLLAAMAAPEQPKRLEAICQRHYGIEACRVW